MPLAARTVEPIYLGRRPLREEETGEEVVQVAVTQNAVLGALVQLASLVRHADDLFCDLADECQKVFEQTERIIHRVKRIKEGVGRLDSKKVPIPVGDLKLFSTVQDHHVSKHGFDCSFFAPDSRPHCLKSRYSLCEVTPVGALRGADLYRKDGMRSSHLFKLWPIVLKEHHVKTPDLNLPRKPGKAMTFNKKYKQLTPRPKTVHGIDSLDIIEQVGKESEDTSSSTNDSLSKSQPSIMVAVDTSGAGFYRMSSFRQSVKGTASLDRKKRRRTVSGVPGQIMREIEVFEREKRDVRNTPRNYSFDDLDTHKEPEKDDSMKQYFDEFDAKMEEKAEQVHASREKNKLLKFLPCRRTRSLPRCVKVGAEQCRGVMVFEQEENCKDKDKSIATATSGYNSSSLSLGSAGSSSTSSRATKRSSIIGNKIRSFVTGTLRPRPKSLDLDAIDVLGNDADVEDDSSNSSHSKVTLKRKFSPSMPDDISSLSSSRESKVGPGTYYYFTSSTLPRAQARKYDFPWESLPKDWTTSVKLREISKRRREERNSSSGNWSGSSNRQSLDSARSSTLPSSTSQHSLGRDSGRDSPSLADDKNISDQTGKESGLSTFMPLNTKANTASDTEQWLASLAKRAATRQDATAAGSDVTDSLNRLSQLTKQNIQALEDTFSPVLRPLMLFDDEVSSVHSLDQDGFYTSFHNDSGLRRSTGTLLDGDGDLTPVKETNSMLSMGSSNTIDSVIFRPMGKETPRKSDSPSSARKVRPPPPLRCGSRLSSSSSLVDTEEKTKSRGDNSATTQVGVPSSDLALAKSIIPPGESSQSESDQETVFARLRTKTKISSRSIPSWCLVSDEDSTDSSSMCLAGAQLKNMASPALSQSILGEGAIPKSSTPQSVASGSSAEGSESEVLQNCRTLPRRYLESKVWEEDSSDQCNSWPRSRRSQQQPMAGILKRDKSPAGSMKMKTLNFAPMVNMFDHHSSQGIELPLHAMSSTSSSSSVDCSSDASTPGMARRLSLPLSTREHVHSKSKMDTGVRPGQNGEMSAKTPTRAPQLYAVSQMKGLRDVSSESSDKSVSSSESSIPSLSDCGQGGYLDMSAGLGHRSADTWSSSSSAALSDFDIDSSLTYVSMSSSNSTPTNSTLALGPDDLPTPVNSPKLQHDTYRISSVTLSGVHTKDNGPLGTQSCSSSQASTVSSLGSGAEKQALGSFAANASTEAAPVSWIGDRLNSMTLSGDSGFSSPTTPTTSTAVHHHFPHHYQDKQSASRSSRSNIQLHEAQVHCAEVTRSTDFESRKTRTSVPPSQLSVGQRHSTLKASHSNDSGLSQASTPRSDSYRAATGELYQKGRKHGDGSVRSKTRSQSSAHMPGHSSHPSSHRHMSKSVSCPTGVLADVESATRADSYRFAVRNTQGIVGEVAARNTSYRMATMDDDPVFDSRMDAANLWDQSKTPGGRDMRRMGITDIDQLKCYDSDSSSSRTSASSLSGKSSSRGFAGINSSRKKMKPEVQNLLRGDKTPSPEIKRMSKVSGKNSKEKDKGKSHSSTYIRFDPIFEQGDDMYSSTDTLRAESVEMIASEEGFLMGDKVVGQLPPGRVRANSGRKHVDEKAVMSILDSIKTTIKSMSGKNTAEKDMWKYDGGL